MPNRKTPARRRSSSPGDPPNGPSELILYTTPEILAEPLRGPDSELGAPVRLHAVSDRDDHVEVVELDVTGNLPVAFRLNYSGFPNSWSRIEFTLVEHVPDVLVDGRNGLLKQLRELSLAQPDRLVLEPNFDPGLLIAGREFEKFDRERRRIATDGRSDFDRAVDRVNRITPADEPPTDE